MPFPIWQNSSPKLPANSISVGHGRLHRHPQVIEKIPSEFINLRGSVLSYIPNTDNKLIVILALAPHNTSPSYS
jgi:hypothetical protein